MKQTGAFLLFLFAAGVFAEGEEAAQITFINKIDNLEVYLLLEYVPSGGIREIYRVGEASIQINTLSVDNKPVDYYDSGGLWEFIDDKEIYNGDGVVKRELSMFPAYNGWKLYISPHANPHEKRGYAIPKETKEVDIYYNILYPNREMSEEFHSKILLEGPGKKTYGEAAQITLLKKTKHTIDLLLEYVPSEGIREIYKNGGFSILINTLLVDNEPLNYDFGDGETPWDHIEIYNGDGVVKRELTLYYNPPPYDCWMLLYMPHGTLSLREYDIPEKTKEIEIYYNILYPNREMSEEFHSKILLGQRENPGKINIRAVIVCISLLVLGLLLIGYFYRRKR